MSWDRPGGEGEWKEVGDRSVTSVTPGHGKKHFVSSGFKSTPLTLETQGDRTSLHSSGRARKTPRGKNHAFRNFKRGDSSSPLFSHHLSSTWL